MVLTGSHTESFKCLPKHDGAIVSAIQQILLNSAALESLLRCTWVTRLWTLQEALMSPQLIYAVENQLVDGDYVSELVACLETCSHEYWLDDDGETNWAGGDTCYGWNARNATFIYSRQCRLKTGSSRLTLIKTVFGGEQQYKELRTTADGILMSFEEASIMAQGRQATCEEDYVYGLLGISQGGSKIDIEYGIEWQVVMRRLQQAGMITERQLASPTVNSLLGMSWLPMDNSGFQVFRGLERATAFMSRPTLSWSRNGQIILGMEFEWTDWNFETWPRFSRDDIPSYVVNGTIQSPEFPGSVATVTGLSGVKFTDLRMAGTHVMLCEDFDRSNKATICIRISHAAGVGRVRREDGYVLEVSNWFTKTTHTFESLGRQWLLY